MTAISNFFCRIAGRALQIISPLHRQQLPTQLQDLQPAINALRRNRIPRPSIDHLCWRYFTSRRTTRDFDEYGGIRRRSRTPPRRMSPRNSLSIRPGGLSSARRHRKVPSLPSMSNNASASAPLQDSKSAERGCVSPQQTEDAPVPDVFSVSEGSSSNYQPTPPSTPSHSHSPAPKNLPASAHGATPSQANPASDAPQSQGPPAPQQSQTAPRETARQATIRARKELMEQYIAQRDAWQSWRDSYGTLLQQHLAGIDPGFGARRWKSTWTREEFDIQHLAQARRMTRKVCATEKTLIDVFGLARRLGIEPVEWQISQFPDQPHYYTESQEDALAARAPTAAIEQWRDGLPDSPRQWIRPQLDTGDVQVGDAGYHRVEYPDDMDFEPDRDVEIWDSTSEIAMVYRKRLIDGYQVAEPPGWTQVKQQDREPHNTKMNLSHWF